MFYRLPLVLFFSFTLIFSIFSNLPIYAAPTSAFIEFVINDGQDNINPAVRIEPYKFTAADSAIVISGLIDSNNKCKHKGINDFGFVFSNIYIIQGAPKEDQRLTDVSGKPNVIGDFATILFDRETIAFLPPSGNGLEDGQTYTIVVDNCQDGHYNSDEDRSFENAFTVELDYNTLPIRHHTLTDVQGLKEGAKLNALAFWGLDKAAIALIGVFTTWAIAQCGALVAYYNQAPEASAELCKKLSGYVGAFTAFVFGLKVNAIKSLQQKYDGLAADPLDMNYKKLTTLSPVLSYENTQSNHSITNSIIDVNNQAQNEALLVEALTHAIERYNGALEDGNPKWAIIHANEIKHYSDLLGLQTTITDNALNSQLNIIQTDDLNVNEEDLIKAKEDQSLVKQVGFNSTQIRELKNFGFSDSDIKEIQKTYLSFDPSSITDDQLTKPIKDILKQRPLIRSALQELVSDVNKEKNEIIQEFPFLAFNPVVDAGGPYFGREGVPITFSAISPIQNSSFGLSYEWDLDGDGVFDDGNSSTTSYTYDKEFQGYIGLHVSTPDKLIGIGYSPIIVDSNNRKPVITSSIPSEPMVKVLANNVSTFTVAVSDPDNNPVNIQWSIDNETKSSGPSFDYIPNASDVGSHIVQANVIDTGTPVKNVIYYWKVFVVMPDIDKDLWNSNVDCNDNNSAINPSVREIRYNGIDDDCNPQTLDINTPPVAKNLTIGLFQNSVRTISFSGDTAATDVDKDLLTFEIVKGTENGTLGPIKINPFNPAIITADYTPNPNFHGKDSFTFIAKDRFAQSNIAKVNLNVGILQSPTAVDRTIIVTEDTPTQIELRGLSPDGHSLTFILEGTRSEGTKGQPAMGTIKNITQTSPTTANITYIPPTDFNNDISTRVDSIAFAVKDGEPVPGFEGREIDRGGITIKFTGVNDAPQPYNNIISTQMNSSVGIELRASDADNDFFIRADGTLNNGIKFRINNQPSHGTLSSINSQLIFIGQQPLPLNQTIDKVTYTPDPGFIGKDSFSFIATDGVLDSTEGIITINVKDPNKALSKQFEDGDVILGLSGCTFNCIEWHKNDGTFVKNMHNSNFSIIFGSHTGGDFDSDGNLYITTFDRLSKAGSSDAIQIYNSNGVYIGGLKDKGDFGCLDFTDPTIPHIGSPCMSPESIVFDKYENMYVGGIATAEGDPRFPNDLRDAIRQFDSNDNLLSVYDVDIEDRGSDWIELAPDQCTMYYTSEYIHVKRYNVCTNQQLEDFSNVYGPGRSFDKISGPSPFHNYALRLLQSGDMLVASTQEIWRLDSEGNLIQKYDARGQENWFALNIDSDGKSFWSATLGGKEIYRFDIATGKILQYFKTNNPNIGVSGITIKGEPKISSIEVPPTVQNKLLVINENNQLEINLTGSDIANDPLAFSIVDQPKFGILNNITQLTNNISKVVYIPNPDFDGSDFFTFIANDGKLNSTTTGTIMIARNHAPVANSDDEGIITLQGVPVNISVLANDSDIDIGNPILNDTISIENIDTSETLGNVTLNSDNKTINYVPFAPQYIGLDSFNYTITDRYGLTDTAKVTVNVLSSNNIPVANNQTIETLENTTKTIQLIANDADPQDILFYQIFDGPSNGFITNFNFTTGLAEYHPLRTFHGEDSFTFMVHDGKDKSLPGIVNITVIDDNINDAPNVESERISANVSQQIAIDVLQNDVDPNGDFLTLTNFTGPFNGTAVLNQDQTITYQSDPDFNGSDVLYYRVSDQFGKFDIGQLIVDVQGNAIKQIIQVPSDRLVTTTRDQSIDIELVATATIDRPTAFFIIDGSDNGTLGDITNGSNLSSSIKYTPNTGFIGDDSFTYVAIDNKGVVSNIGTIRVSIDNIVGNAPVARDSLVKLDEDTSIPIQLDASDPDVHDDLTYSIESQPISGKIVSFDSFTGSLVYEPNANFNGNDGFLFKAVDQTGLESNIAMVLITVNPINDPPVANNQQLETEQNTPLQITLSGTDHIDNDAIAQFRIVNSPTNGQLSTFNQVTGEVTYTPNNNYFGNDSFTFKVIDRQGLESTESAQVSINIKEVSSPVNNPPVAIDKTVETNSNTSLSITLEGTDIDQGDTISGFTIISQPTNGKISNFISNMGTLTYTPNNNFEGQDTFTFKVTDSRGLESTNSGLVFINVKSTQEPPPNNEQPPLPLPSSVCIDSNNSGKPKGTQGNDELIGTSQRDTITGLGGNDRFNGCSGDDTLNGNLGNDGIAGGPDNDKLHGNEGNDYLQGDSGSDSLYGNEGNDIFIGNEGRDIFFCGSGDDTILDFDYPLDVKLSDCEEF